MRAGDTIAVIGTGVIGSSWAVHFLAHGFKVSATDPAEGAEGRLRDFVEENWPTVERLGLSDGASIDNLTFGSDVVDAVRNAAFVQESGPELLQLMADIETDTSADTIIATSSSGLLISELQEGARHPERILLGHPFNPPHIIPLVEVLGGRLTSPENVARAMEFYGSIGKRPIQLRKEVKGHVANRLQVALWREAYSLVERGVATVEDIDTAISNGPGLRWAVLGPFLNLHASGGRGGIRHILEHLGAAQREWSEDLGGFPETDDYITTLVNGVHEELEGFDFAATLRRRDELLVDLIAAKKSSSEIP